MSFLKRLFGGATSSGQPPPPSPVPQTSTKPELPSAVLEEFKAWFLAQRKPAVALLPNPDGLVGQIGSRLGGPAWLSEGESWPCGSSGVPLEFLAQLDLSECLSLPGFPDAGIVQFFIGRDDLYGANFDDLRKGSYLVRAYPRDAVGAMHPPPPLVEVNGVFGSDFSPFSGSAVRERGIALIPQNVEDRVDQSNFEAETRINELYKAYDVSALEDWLEDPVQERPIRHHAGGYPAFTQSDIRYEAANADLDQVLLRLTSDDYLMWGDVGEAVFMIRLADLEAGSFGAAAFSWDCH